MILNCLITCLFGITVYSVIGTVAHVAIVGGEKAIANEFPYQVSLMVPGNNNKCGGGIIGEQFILTAAHCVIQEDGEFFDEHITVLAGTDDLHVTKGSAMIIPVHKVYVPEEYEADLGGTPGDIAVLKLMHPLRLSVHIKKLELPMHKNENYDGKSAKIAGFGYTHVKSVNGKEFGDRMDSHLRFAVADVLHKSDPHYFPFLIAKKQLSARIPQHGFKSRGVCLGDSGGPLVYDNTVIGILNVSPRRCSEETYGAIYTRVSHYLDFIHNAIHDNCLHNIRTQIQHH